MSTLLIAREDVSPRECAYFYGRLKLTFAADLLEMIRPAFIYCSWAHLHSTPPGLSINWCKVLGFQVVILARLVRYHRASGGGGDSG